MCFFFRFFYPILIYLEMHGRPMFMSLYAKVKVIKGRLAKISTHVLGGILGGYFDTQQVPPFHSRLEI